MLEFLFQFLKIRLNFWPNFLVHKKYESVNVSCALISRRRKEKRGNTRGDEKEPAGNIHAYLSIILSFEKINAEWRETKSKIT